MLRWGWCIDRLYEDVECYAFSWVMSTGLFHENHVLLKFRMVYINMLDVGLCNDQVI